MSNEEKKDSENLKKDDNFNFKFFFILLCWAFLSGASVYFGWLIVKEERDIIGFFLKDKKPNLDISEDNQVSVDKGKKEDKQKLAKSQKKALKSDKKSKDLGKSEEIVDKKAVKSTKKPNSDPKKETFTKSVFDLNTVAKSDKIQAVSNGSLQSSTWFSDYNTMKKNVQYYNEIHPFIYGIKGNLKNTGELTSGWSHKAKLDRVAELRSLNPKVKIIPTIFRWENDQKKISEVIGYKNASKIRDKHIAIIMKEIETYSYDGIDIDYEGMECHKKPYFEKFLMLLSEKMKEKNKILSVAVHPKTFSKNKKKIYCKGNNKVSTVSFRETWRGPSAHDYSFFAKYADKVKIMAYEFHPRKYKDPGPGPQAPNIWLKDVIQYAKTKIPTHKLYMAIPTYGYDWGLNCKPRVRPVFYGNIKERMKIGKHYQPTNINKIISKYGKQKEWKNLSKFSKIHSGKVYEDPSIWYTKNGCDRVAFYMNAEAFVKKMELLMSYNLGGFSFWQLRKDNDPGINLYLSKLLEKQNKVSEESLTQKSSKEKKADKVTEKSENDVVFQKTAKPSLNHKKSPKI